MILLTFTKKKMSDIVVKYNRLNKTARQEVIDFMDFLLSKQKISKSNFLTPYKNKILNVFYKGPGDALEINSIVIVEIAVLGNQCGIFQILRNFIPRNDSSFFFAVDII